MNETAVSTTFPRERRDIPFKVSVGSATGFIGQYVVSGLLLGGMCGGIVGTGVAPLFGSVYGSFIGAIVGTVTAVPIGLILLGVILIKRTSLRSAVQLVDRIAVLSAALIGLVLLMRGGGLFIAVVDVSAGLAATFVARFGLMHSIGKPEREWIARSDMGAGVRFEYVVFGSVACALLLWIAGWFSGTLFF